MVQLMHAFGSKVLRGGTMHNRRIYSKDAESTDSTKSAEPFGPPFLFLSFECSLVLISAAAASAPAPHLGRRRSGSRPSATEWVPTGGGRERPCLSGGGVRPCLGDDGVQLCLDDDGVSPDQRRWSAIAACSSARAASSWRGRLSPDERRQCSEGGARGGLPRQPDGVDGEARCTRGSLRRSGRRRRVEWCGLLLIRRRLRLPIFFLG